MDVKTKAKNKNSGGVSIGVGSISILAIFVVLCLTTLATLSLVSARADLSLTTKTVETTSQYYEADLIAEEKLMALMDLSSNENWQKSIPTAGYELEINDNNAYVTYKTPINEKKDLFSKIEIELKDSKPTGTWDKVVWKTVVVENLEIKNELNLYK